MAWRVGDTVVIRSVYANKARWARTDDGRYLEQWAWACRDGEAQGLGVLTAEEAAEVRATAERMIREHPWTTGWEDRRPDPTWPLPSLPDGWDVV